MFIFDDADLDKAIPAAAMAIFANSGQVCFAGSRLYIQRGIFDKVVRGVAKAGAAMRIGSALDPQSQLGPLVSQQQLSRVLSNVESGISEGAELVFGGFKQSGWGREAGYEGIAPYLETKSVFTML